MDHGVEFSTTAGGQYVLHQEGGHKYKRIYCRGDSTGEAIEKKLANLVRDDPDIMVYENHTAVNLITNNQFSKIKLWKDKCLGAYVLNRETEEIRTIESEVTFLATGGAGRAFLYTTNPENANGDGVAMAYRAGARIGNMEFFQFHPTVLYDPNPEKPEERRFLLTEALRGKAMGGKLTLEKDSIEDFVLEHDPRGSHATRDIVARAIDVEMKRHAVPHVWLNVTPQATGKSKDYTKENFPKIFEHCLKKGIDITEQCIPVIPASHYMCGGVVVDDSGLTDIDGLYAIGEVACTGIMGANRLASNSLPECALYGKLAVIDALTRYGKLRRPIIDIPEWKSSWVHPEIDAEMRNRFWDTIRAAMMQYCGIERSQQRLQICRDILGGLVEVTKNIYRHFLPTHEIIELRNLAITASLVAQSALYRRESRGGHYRSDYPSRNDAEYLGDTIIQKDIGIRIFKRTNLSQVH
jgi:L-aspartate oxidase